VRVGVSPVGIYSSRVWLSISSLSSLSSARISASEASVGSVPLRAAVSAAMSESSASTRAKDVER